MILNLPFSGNLNQLHEELTAAFPDWRRLLTEAPFAGEYLSLASVASDGKTLRIECPDATKPAAVKRVVAAHVPNPGYGKPAPDPDVEALKAALESGKLDADLLPALIRRLAKLDPELRTAAVAPEPVPIAPVELAKP